MSAQSPVQQALFGAGCFWGVEEVFRHVRGVQQTMVGYAGGRTENPTYEQVCSGKTGHAEVVLVTFDPAHVIYEELLDVFWHAHDPTAVDRQGPDIGEQYRSVIFYYTPAQQQAALAAKNKLDESGKVSGTIATQILPAPAFYRAEEYHQQYVQKTGRRVC